MPQNWRLHSIITLILLLLSAYYLTPTIAHFDIIRENAEKSQKAVPFYLNLFPKEEIKLGLDLQGGIYVEMEVVLEDAIKNRLDLFSSEIERLLQKQSFAPAAVVQESDTSDIKITPKKDEDHKSLAHWISDNYRNVLEEDRSKQADKSLFYKLTDSYANQTKDLVARQALETIRNRIDRYGVSEPSIVRLGSNRIGIELPGMTDPERALNLIKKGGRLEFKLVDKSVSASEVQKMVAEAREALQLREGFSEEVVAKVNEKLKGKIPEGDEILFEVQYDPVSKKSVGGIPYLLKKKAELTGEMLRNTQVNVHDNEPYVSLSFNNLGTQLFAELTKANIGKQLAIVLDGNVSKAPVIQSEIPSGEAQITLGFGDYRSILKEAEDLVLVLHEGALPARMKELTKTVVGPSLGRDSIERGMHISLLAAVLVILFMIVYYRVSGLLADIALALNILFMMAALAIFQATLTLPGIAGIVLTIGMAVDANVLIFERMREEIRAGKRGKAALKAGYENAMSAILDSNITTFLAGAVLYQFGTGSIRGFAVTLMIGIATTLYTSLYITRILQEYLVYGLKREELSV